MQEEFHQSDVEGEKYHTLPDGHAPFFLYAAQDMVGFLG